MGRNLQGEIAPGADERGGCGTACTHAQDVAPAEEAAKKAKKAEAAGEGGQDVAQEAPNAALLGLGDYSDSD